MPYGWTKEQIKAAIDRCERDVEAMIARHATPREIEARRSGLATMRKWLEDEERGERHGKAEGAGDAGNQGVCR